MATSPAKEPNENTTRKMFTEAMKIVLLFIMKNHMYTFVQVKLQSRGGPIGLELTGVLAQLNFGLVEVGQAVHKGG